jgi:hypothetical protein
MGGPCTQAVGPFRRRHINGSQHELCLEELDAIVEDDGGKELRVSRQDKGSEEDECCYRVSIVFLFRNGA